MTIIDEVKLNLSEANSVDACIVQLTYVVVILYFLSAMSISILRQQCPSLFYVSNVHLYFLSMGQADHSQLPNIFPVWQLGSWPLSPAVCKGHKHDLAWAELILYSNTNKVTCTNWVMPT
jgi:hypothetical protein